MSNVAADQTYEINKFAQGPGRLEHVIYECPGQCKSYNLWGNV